MSDVRGPSPTTIERCVSAWQRAKAALEADEQLATDEQAIAAALDADPNILPADELLRRIVRAVVFAEAREEESALLVSMLRARQHRYANRAAFLREELFEVMMALERRTFAAPYATVSLRAGTPSAVITDEQALPDEYIRIIRQPDGRLILADLKQGVVIPGAVLNNGMPTVALRKARPMQEEEAA